MNWKAFENKFHVSWREKMKPFIESEDCDEIYAYLKDASKRGEEISPLSINTYRAFFIAPLTDLKCVILGEPYSDFANNSPINTGLYLDNSVEKKETTELNNFLRGLEIELYNGLCLDYKNDYDTEYLALRGVLMLNGSMTTNWRNYKEHEKVWKPFYEFLFKRIISKKKNVPIILIGEYAKSFKHLIEKTNYVFELDSPNEFLKEWDTKGVFQKVDEILENTRGMGGGIQWLNIKNDVPF